jgi:hypothetical protein
MKEYEFANMINTAGELLIPYTRLIYELIILVFQYYFFEQLLSHQNYSTNTARIIIILFAMSAILIHWLIWRDTIRTVLFAAVLVILITYNLRRVYFIDEFLTKAEEGLISSTQEHFKNGDGHAISTTMISEFPSRLITPDDIKPIRQSDPIPFDTTEHSINSINEAYPDGQYVSITDSAYAKMMIDSLFDTPQIKNINIHPPECRNYEHFTSTAKSTTSMSDHVYNDNCPAICACRNGLETVQHGRELSQCTNRDSSKGGVISSQQLELISSNTITPLRI